MVIAHNNVCACVKQFWKQASTHSPFEGLTFQHHAVLMLPPPDFFHKPSRTNKAKLPDCFIFLNALFSLIHHPVISKFASQPSIKDSTQLDDTSLSRTESCADLRSSPNHPPCTHSKTLLLHFKTLLSPYYPQFNFLEAVRLHFTIRSHLVVDGARAVGERVHE